MKYPEHCGCTPGTPENGWHQIWCKGCLDIEIQNWRRFAGERDLDIGIESGEAYMLVEHIWDTRQG